MVIDTCTFNFGKYNLFRLMTKTQMSCSYYSSNPYKLCQVLLIINPYLTNGFSYHYHLGESTFIFRGRRCDFKILFHFSIKFL